MAVRDSELTKEELILLYDAAISNINSQFELWLMIYFAVVIASYLAGDKLPKALQYLVATLYKLVSVLLAMILKSAVAFAGQFSAFGAFADPGVWDWIIVGLRSSIWVLGTIATIFFIFKGRRDGAAYT